MKTPILFQVTCQNSRLYGKILNSESHIKTCPKCDTRSRDYLEPVEIEIFENVPSKWPDIISLIEGASFAVSEKLMLEMRKSGLDFETAQVVCRNSDAAPNYYILIPPRVLAIDTEKSGFICDPICDVCGFSPIKKLPAYLGPFLEVPDTRSWDGKPFFRLKNLSFPLLYCSFECVEIARAHRWKGFQFRPLRLNVPQGTILSSEIGNGVNYLSKTWPPEFVEWGH